jgi:hypothetical protein
MKRKLAAAVLTMLAAGLAAGCGGDDKGAATTGAGTTTTDAAASAAPLTRPEYIAAAEEICRAKDAKLAAASAKLAAAGKKTGTVPARQVRDFLLEVSLPAQNELLTKLRALVPPKADEKLIDGYIAALAGGIDTVTAAVQAAKYNIANPFADANDRAKAYGMKDCVID